MALLLGAVIAAAQILSTAELVTPFGTSAAGVLLAEPVVGHALSYGILVWLARSRRSLGERHA